MLAFLSLFQCLKEIDLKKILALLSPGVMSRALLNPELCVFDRRLQRSQLWCTPSAPSAPSGSVTHSTGSASRSVRGSLLAVASLGRCFARRQGAPSKCVVNSHKAEKRLGKRKKLPGKKAFQVDDGWYDSMLR